MLSRECSAYGVGCNFEDAQCSLLVVGGRDETDLVRIRFSQIGGTLTFYICVTTACDG